MRSEQTQTNFLYPLIPLRQRSTQFLSTANTYLTRLFFFLLLVGSTSLRAQNPISGNQDFQILSEGNMTFTGYTHVHGPLGVGSNLILNDNGTLAEICMDGVGTYVFPGDGSTTTGLLVKGGITWTAGGAKVLGGKYMHIGSSTGCTQSDNGVNQATQVLPTGGVYNQAKRLEGALDQTPSPAVFQTVGFDFTTLFSTYRTRSQAMAGASNSVQLYNANNVAISGNTVSSAQNVQVNSLATGVNYLNLTQTSLNNITEFKFNANAMPSATKLLVINVPLTSNFTWNNSNMPGLSGTNNGAYILWNFSGTTTYNLTVNTASLIIGSIFAPNHNLIKSTSGSGDIDGGLFAKTISLGVGEIHHFPFNGAVLTTPEICGNGIDDDADGLVDGNDPDCMSFCATGSLTIERWTGISGTLISDLTNNANYPNSPSYVGTMASFDGPDDIADNYGTRVRGYIAPTVTGTYSFNLTGDDDCSLYLSTDASPSNKVLIANFSGWTGTTDYTKYTTQTSANITLTAGQKYYVELLHKEGTGGDHFQVYWKTPASSTWTIIPGTNLIPLNCPSEICNNGLDDDGDGLVDCGDSDCPACTTLSCNDGVKVVSKKTATATGAGAAGIPSLTNFFVPAGNNRVVFITAAFEREHCQGGDNCTLSNNNGSGLGDNFAAPSFSVTDGEDVQITGRFSGPGGSIDRKNPLYLPTGDLRFGTQFTYLGNTLNSGTTMFSREIYYIAIYESEIQTLLGGAASGNINITLPDIKTPLDNADDAVILGYTFVNVDQTPSGIVRSGTNVSVYNIKLSDSGLNGDYTIPITDLDNGQEPNDPQDGLLLVAYNGAANYGFKPVSGYTQLSNITTTNSNGAYIHLNEPDGMSVTTQFRSGPSSGIINSVTVQSNAPSSTLLDGGIFAAFTLSSCKLEICNNGIDDDNDGLIDCADAECKLGLSVSTSASTATICSGTSTTLTATGSGGTTPYTFAWSNSLGSGASKTVSPTANTTYTVTITSANGCTATSQVTITVNATPAASAGANSTICEGATATLVATGGTSYAWSNGLGTGAAKVVSPSSTTTYTVTVTNAAGCTATNQATVTVNAAPIANAGADQTVCGGTTVTLTASGGTSYAWSNSLGTGATKNVTPTSTTTYTVTVTNANGCTATDQVVVNVNAAPVASAGSNIAVCYGTATTLTASASGGTGPYTYAWNNSLGSGATKNVNPLVSTTYTVTVTGSLGCTSSSQVTVSVNAVPSASAGADITICPLTSTTLTATGSGAPSPYSFNWSNGFSGATQTVSPLLTTTYKVTVTSSNGCIATAQKKVTVGICTEICNNGMDDDGDGLTDCADADCGPTANAGSDISICPGTPAFLSVGVTGGSAPYTYAWSNGLGSGASKSVSPLTTTTYSVTVTSASGCTNVDQITVTVNACSENCTNGIDDDGDGLVDCADPDCAGVTAPVLADDSYTTCPGLAYSNRVTYNDGNLNNPAFSIAVEPQHGTVTIDWTGKFVYTPNTFECLTDYFTYQVCNQTSGCCETAVVSITLGDNTLPVLTNVPADLTISCDDAVPSAPVVTAFDQCPGIYMDFEEASSQNFFGGCGSYTITRTWTATDFCGNAATSHQNITVLDQTKPELFQLYTLEGGAKMVAGYAQRVTHDWKYVRFPITFKATPVVLASVSTNTDVTPVVVQVRNVSMQGFEMRLREEEAFDGKHGTENVSWLAIDAEKHDGNLKWEAGTLANVSEVPNALNFQQTFSAAPMFFSSAMTNVQSDPASLRQIGLSDTGVQVFAQEEQSADAEVVRTSETAGYLAIKANSSLVDQDGTMFGEAGKLNVTNAWATVSLARKYTKPVVIVGGLSNNDTQPVTLRVRNISSTRFEVALQEWSYLDGAHPAESISWMVVEGGVPGNQSFYCSGKASNLKPNVNIFAVDNCDDLVTFSYNENSVQENIGLVQNHTWTAIDDCGNTTLISRFDTCQVAALKVKGIIYGSVTGSNSPDLMRDDLRIKHYLPTVEPYTALPNFPYVKYLEHENNGNGNGSGNSDPMVVICHLSGTPEEQTMTVPQSELGYYLSIGDMVGSCGSNNGGKVTICHNPGTANQLTLTISQNALLAHLAHGDLIGTCSGSGNDAPLGASNAQYQTIADGNWTDASTWLGGQMPGVGNITGKTISVNHKVIVQNSSLVLRSNSKLYVTGGSLTFKNQDFEVRDGEAYFNRSVLDMSTAGNIKITNAAGKLQFKDCTVDVGQSIKNQSGGKIKMDHVELEVSENYENTGGADSLINVCAVINGDFINNLLSKVYLSNVNLRLPNGGLTNLGIVSGGGVKLLIENGNLINTLATWTAPLTQYCVSGTVGIGLGLLPAIEDCNNISNLFTPCNCYESGNATSGSGSGTTGVVSNIVSQINPGHSYGDGELDDPTTLDVTGNDAVVDWMLVELRNPGNEAEVLGYQSVVLRRNGELVGENGDSILVFPGLEEGDYYVSLRHRNHLGIMTLDPVFLSVLDPILIDFSDPATPIKGGTTAGKNVNGKRMLWGGDFNGDGKVVYQGPNNDVFYLFTRVVGDANNTDNLANYIVPGYELQDFNLDGKVIYQGPLNDRGAMLFYSILSNPNNGALLANFITLDFIP